MRIPKPNEPVRIECLGTALVAIVHSVAPASKQAVTAFNVTLRVTEDFQRGDIVYWLDESGKRVQRTQVHKVSWKRGVKKIVLATIPGPKSKRN